MRYFVLSGLLFAYSLVSAQTLHERTWFFGGGHALHFNNNQPIAGGIPKAPGHAYYGLNGGNPSRASIAVSDVQGNLQFFVQFLSTSNSSITGINLIHNVPKVFDAFGRPFPNGNISANFNSGDGYPICVIPHPGNPDLYYLLYSFDAGLIYSIVDMRLNGGLGDIVLSEKNQKILGFGKVIGIKTTTIAGCDGVWIVARSRTDNAYYSFKIDENGIHTEPVISKVGQLPLIDYQSVDGYYGGILKADNRNLRLAAATQSGIELYDFEPCSGRLKNARLIDTTATYGLCFSPDDSKLYAACNKPSYKSPMQGEIYQYEINLPTTPAITASRTLVMRNTIYELITPFGPVYPTGLFGELKLGIDGKIYVSKNNRIADTTPCSVFFSGPDHNSVPAPATNNCLVGQYLHVIHNPNAKGMACNPELDYLKLNDLTNTPGYLLQSDIRIAPKSPPDTAQSKSISVAVCFAQEGFLSAPEQAACYLWDNGLATRDRVVDRPGTYWVSYFKGCTYQTDTFQVKFISLPEVPQLQYGCPEEGVINIPQPKDDATLFTYTLKHLDKGLVDSARSKTGYRFERLSVGAYSLWVQAGSCDTTLLLQLAAYPAPEVNAWPQDTTILYGDTIQLHASGADRYAWGPLRWIDDVHLADPRVNPQEPTLYFVVGRNAYDCKDTAYVQVRIDYNLPDLLPNAFSPNGDGVNDVFRVAGLTYQQVLQFRVYNRFGQEVYAGFDPAAGWDGSYKGQACELGTYYYYVELGYPDGRRKVLKGDVVLLR